MRSVIGAVVLLGLAAPLSARADAVASSTLAPGGPRIEGVSLRLTSPSPDVTFFREQGPAPSAFERPPMVPLCAAPCTAELLAGRYVLGMGIEGREPVSSEVGIRMDDGALDVVGEYRDRRGLRIGGVVLASASVIASVAGVIYIHENMSTPDCGADACIQVAVLDTPALVSVVVSGLVGLAGGLILSQILDGVDIDMR